MFTKMAKFITCNFCTGHLFMASLAAVHSFGICTFPILNSVQQNIHCFFFYLECYRCPEKNKTTSSSVPWVEIIRTQIEALPGSSNCMFSFHNFSSLLCEEEKGVNPPQKLATLAVVLSC